MNGSDIEHKRLFIKFDSSFGSENFKGILEQREIIVNIKSNVCNRNMKMGNIFMVNFVKEVQ
ncbi:hypothetical protein [Chryseobacterium sp. ERMR1:04]|uniref:hypothetical protein n=1 Tax=Chryseobacterium sp. ERMR1:04 TaxID=1705393 RepID=UPI0006C8DB2E|nr:hypothetical protein [Chryseobacterium sp. ERMR1:04]KPH14781.1 hypothetical protein AMQ68_04895 [Chryseobacterium sp. ERMR1:04]